MRLSVVLWIAFVATVAATGIVLLQACGVVATAVGWNFCPAAPEPLSVEADRMGRLQAEATRLELDLETRKLACMAAPAPSVPPLELPNDAGPPRPQQTAMIKPPPPPPPPKAEPPKSAPPLPADRWEKKDLGLLKGCWQLGRDTVTTMGFRGRTERCAVKAGRICFNESGGGQREESINCPSAGPHHCTAPIRATFGGDGALRTNQPTVECKPVVWNGPPSALSCRRVSDTLALCRDAGGFEHEFRRGS